MKAKSATKDEAQRPPMTALIIDSNPFFGNALRRFLADPGRIVILATSAEDAIAKTREHKPSIVLLNNELEDASSLELIPEILLENPESSVFLLASSPSIAEAVQAIKQGATDYVEGPLQPELLKQIIANA